MSYFDDVYLLDGSEPAPWDEESAPHGLCDTCETPLDGEDDCAVCAPRCAIEYSPVRASFVIDIATGAVRENGWTQ